MRFQRVAQRRFGIDRIAVPAAVARARQHATLLQFGHDPQHRTLGDSHLLGDIAHGLVAIGSPDPLIGFVSTHRELAVLVDDLHGQVVCEWRNSHETNFASRVVGHASELDATRLARWGFPSHALIVRAEPQGHVVKSLRDRSALDAAIAACIESSPTRQARVETDMRAHLNPTRMNQIAALGVRLVERLRCRCPRCRAPGSGRIDVGTGLPCGWCGHPTGAVLAEIHGCAACPERLRLPRSDGLRQCDPAHCDRCNP